MKFIKLSATVFAGGLFLTACNSSQPEQIADINPYPQDAEQTEVVPDVNDYFAKENLDLRRVGSLLEKSENPAEFEYLLNSADGVNNLDLNGDGYTDYISVSEFDDRDNNERGLSLFSRFGPDIIQEIATVIFNRNGRDSSGARILLTGNDQIYGDDNYYETNWLDRSLGIANWLFSDRDTSYRSSYYYDNYPQDYEVYQVVDTPVYRTRIEQLYPVSGFVQTSNPTLNQIKIKSPYNGRSADKIYSKLSKPTKEQKEFKKNNPNKPEFIQVGNNRRNKNSTKSDNKSDGDRNDFDRTQKNENEKPQMREKQNKMKRENVKQSNPVKAEKQNVKPSKQNNGGNGKGNGGGGNGKGKKN